MKPTGKCPNCERVFELRKDGKLRAHTRADGFVPNCRHACEGSGLQFELPKRPAHRASA